MQNAQSLYQQARIYHQNGDLNTAKTLYFQALAIMPNLPEAQHMLGLVHYQLGEFQQATTYISHALKLQPKNVDYLNNYGLALLATQQEDAALASFQQAILIAPKDLDIQLNIANTLLILNRFEEAAGYYRRLLRVQPKRQDIRDALCHCLTKVGNHAHQQGNFKLAEAAFSEAIQFSDKEAIYYYNLANAQRELTLPQAALKNYQQALRLNPNDADIHNNCGNVQRELGELDAAIQSYQQALRLNPNLHHALVHLVHQKQHVCDWADLDQHIQTIRGWVKDIPTAQISPFAFLAMPNTTASEQLQCASNWVIQRYSGYLKSPLEPTNLSSPQNKAEKNTTQRKLKIGYLSADFRLHPLAFLITDVIAHHDQSTFDVIGFSYGANDKSAERKTLEKAFTAFYDMKDWSEIECATKIQALGVDVLVDLTGFTQSSRTGIVALKPSPINVSWLGFAGTMGYYNLSDNATKSLFDYLITDKAITPDSHAHFYAERLLYLPCYQANNRQRPIATAPTRVECALPENAFVFCAFNQTFKITQDIFKVWMQLLKVVPNSVLWLLECNAWARQNLIKEANALGIATERLIFAPRVTIDVHLARHCHADLFLDTLPYNAHTTCSDALWMGLPVLTCIGETFASRVAASLIQSSGLTTDDTNKLIADDLAQYFQKALYLSQHRKELSALKTRLLNARESSGLFNPEKFAKALEHRYQEIWLNHINTAS